MLAWAGCAPSACSAAAGLAEAHHGGPRFMLVSVSTPKVLIFVLVPAKYPPSRRPRNNETMALLVEVYHPLRVSAHPTRCVPLGCAEGKLPYWQLPPYFVFHLAMLMRFHPHFRLSAAVPRRMLPKVAVVLHVHLSAVVP